MFYNISFAKWRMPLAVHCEWAQDRKWARLWICSSKQQIQTLLDGVITPTGVLTEGRDELATLLESVPDTHEQPMVAMKGEVAQTLGAAIVALYNYQADIRTLSDNSHMSGFLLPPDGRSPGEAILVWVDPEIKYHAIVAYSRQQASSLIRGLSDWMPSSDRKRRLQMIEQANMPDRSPTPELKIDGKPAELIHWGALLNKVPKNL